jgi:TonB-dependent receptor
MRIQPSRFALVAMLGLFGGQAFAQTPAPPPADPAPAEADEIIVTGQRGAISRARAAERAADSQVNVISADSIGEFADQNVAESVRRVPGVNVAREEGEGRTMSVRGLPPAFTTVTVNGARIGSVDGDQSFVQLDSIGSELLESITISKSVTPDMDGDTIGGNVELGSLSAFTRKEDSLVLGFSGFNSRRADTWGPEYGVSFTKLLFNDTIGIAGSLQFSQRDNYGDDLVNDAGLSPFAEPGVITPVTGFSPNLVGLRPNEIDHRLEIGTRNRTGATLNLEWRPSDAHQAFARMQYTNLTDEDGRFQNEYETDQADRADELGAVAINRFQLLHRPPTTRATGGPDIDKQIALAEFVDEIFASSVGSKHDLGATSFNWQFDYSTAQAGSDGQYRGRFRVRNVNLDTTISETGYTIVPGAVGGRDPNNPASYAFDQLRRSDIDRTDDIYSLQGELRHDLEIGGRKGFIEVGAKARNRDVVRDTDVFSFDPQSSAFNSVAGIAALRGNLSTLPLFNGNSTIAPVGFFPLANDARARFEQTFNAVRPLLTQVPGESFGGDYSVEEETRAGYIMGQLALTDTLTVTGGVRVEQTDMATQGFFLQLDNDDNPIPAPAVSLANLGTRNKDYTLALPSVHFIWRPNDDIDVRASYNRGLQRPDFGDFANRQSYNFTTRELEAGNPFLDPLTADQFDLSFGWFPNANTALQAGVFYKKFKDFFFDYEGAFAFAGNPITPPTVVASAPLLLETTLNGDEATLIGVELGYSQSLTFLPGFASGLFVEANVTWIDSEATLSSVRTDTLTLPGQADLLGNLSIGWENEIFSVRLAGNYVGESLEVISGNASIYRDEFKRAFVGVDLTGQISLGENLQLTFEGSNLNEARDERVFRGTAETGRIFRQVEDFGRTFTAGFKYRF